MVAQAQSDINTFPAIYKSMNEYDAIGCIHGVYMCPGYKSNAPRQSIVTDVSAGSTKTIINYRYQKYICNYTNKPSFPSEGGLCSHPLTQRPDTPRPMMLQEQDKSKTKAT